MLEKGSGVLMKCTDDSKVERHCQYREQIVLYTKSWLSFVMRIIKKEFILTTETTRSCKQRLLTTVLWGFISCERQDEELRRVVEYMVTLSQHYKTALDLLLGCISINSFRR